MQSDCILQPHEVFFFLLFFTSAVAQMAFMFARPQQYKAHRQAISFFNRMLRFALTVTSAVFTNPSGVRSAVMAYQAAVTSNQATAAKSTACLGPPHSSMVSTAAGAAASAGPCHAAEPQGSTTPAEQGAANLAMLARGVLMEPVFGMLYANFLVPFRVAVPIQFASFLASAWRHVAPICASMPYIDALSAAALQPLCQQANWLIYTAAQLLDWHFPVSPAWLSTASDELCRQPLALLVLVFVWVRVVLWLLAPCVLLYCLERSLKLTFLKTYAANAAGLQLSQQHTRGSSNGTAEQHMAAVQPSQTPPSSPAAQQGASSSRRPPAVQSVRQLQQQSQQQPSARLLCLHQTLQAVQPASLSDLLQPDGLLGSLLRFVLGLGAVLCVLLVSWWVCEVGVLAVMRNREFVCDAEGWLLLK
jgi:hypothetical protein